MSSAHPAGGAQPTVTDAADERRYEATIDGDLAGFTEYVLKHGHLALIHTEVLPAFEGKGVGGALVRHAIEDARRRRLRVIATCPFVRAYVERHPETHDIVVGMAPVPVREAGETG